jgi:MinD-like ATPase involved in chromosome partitioning or flagellar assembly
MDASTTTVIPYLKTLLIAPADRQVGLSSVLHLMSSYGVRISTSLPAFNIDSITEILGDSTIHVVMVDSHTPGYSGEEFVSLRAKSQRPIALVGLSTPGSGEMEQMLGLGLDGVYPSPPTDTSIQAMVKDIPQKYGEISKNWGGGAWQTAPDALRNALAASTQTSFQRAVVVFWSPKGGEGKTTLTTEVAAVLAVTTHLDICIVDANMIHGHQRWNLGASNINQSIVSLAKQVSSIRDDSRRSVEFSSFLDRHLSMVGNLPNLKLLPGMMNSQDASEDAVTGQDGLKFGEELIKVLRNRFDFVLVDLGSALDKALHQAFLRNADFVMVIGSPNHNSLVDIASDVNNSLADKLVARKNFRLILNKWEDAGISPDEVIETIGLKIDQRVRPLPTKDLLRLQNSGKSFIAELHTKKQSPEIENGMLDIARVASLLYPGVSALWENRNKKKNK